MGALVISGVWHKPVKSTEQLQALIVVVWLAVAFAVLLLLLLLELPGVGTVTCLHVQFCWEMFLETLMLLQSLQLQLS